MGDGSKIDIERVRSVLREATREGGEFSMRGLSKAADRHRDTVSDIISGRNNNPTLEVLVALAGALKSDITIFTGESRVRPGIVLPSEDALTDALAEYLEQMPARGPVERKARFLASRLRRDFQPHQDPGASQATPDPEAPARPRGDDAPRLPTTQG